MASEQERELLRCELIIREQRIAIAKARLRMLLLLLPCRLGWAWAREATLDHRETIAHCRYAIEEYAENRRRIRERGTTVSGALCLGGDGYDGWLAPQDRYIEGEH